MNDAINQSRTKLTAKVEPLRHDSWLEEWLRVWLRSTETATVEEHRDEWHEYQDSHNYTKYTHTTPAATAATIWPPTVVPANRRHSTTHRNWLNFFLNC